MKWIYSFFVFYALGLNAQVVINEVMPKPSAASTACDQTLIDPNNSTCGKEYIELYNTSSCSSVDLSCYILASRTQNGNISAGVNIGGSFAFPPGTTIQPLGHIVVGGPNSSATAGSVDFALTNYVGQNNLCLESTRWFLENTSGWIALYDPSGNVVDAIFWTFSAGQQASLNTDVAFSLSPCSPSSCFNGVLRSASQMILSTEINYVQDITSTGLTFSRIPDGGTWQRNINPSIAGANNCNNGSCNTSTQTFQLNATVNQPSCGNNDGSISFNPTPSGSYNYTWSIPSNNTINSANSLSPGSYQITINNNNGCVKDTTILLAEDCPTSSCSITQINNAMASAGFQPLNVSGYPCALYYYNPNTTDNWNTAQSQAAAVGATLLTVCDLAENNAVWNAAVAAGVSGGLWIGYSDQVTEGTWTWIDGSSCSFTNWNSSEPSNSSCFGSSTGEDGAVIQMNNGQWNDVYLEPTGVCVSPASYASLVKVNLCPVVSSTVSPQNVCQGDPVQLTATGALGSSPYTFTWLDPNGNQLGSGSPFSYSPSANITLTAVVSDQYGCTGDQTINITTQNCTPQVADLCCPYEGWDYLLPITITNNAPIATSGNLQTLLIVDTQTPISQGKMQSNGNDIRFIEGVCTNVIPHYIENGINTTQTNIWVRLPSISPNSSITIYLKYGNPTAPSVAVPFTGSVNSMFPSVLTVAGTQNLAGNQTFDWINVPSGTIVTTTNAQPITFNARKIVFSGSFDGKGKGFAAQAGPGAGGSGNGSVGGGGGAYGGNGGGGGNANGGTAYGTNNGLDIDMGSGGGNSDCNGARGGGNINLTASVIDFSGSINCSGNDNNVNSCSEEGGGGGSGGGVLITTDKIVGNGLINAQGGTGENSPSKEGGGGGGGGRIKLFYSQSNQFTGTTQVNGAAAGTGGQSGMQPGQNGTFHAASVPGLTFNFSPESPVSIPDVQFGATTVCENNPSVFTDQTTLVSGGTISAWEWNFGVANATSADQNPNYTYGSAGQYTVTLVVTSSTGCVDSIQNQVVVNSGVLANFTGQNVCLGTAVNFSDQSSVSATSWQWDFQDGNTSILANPSHTYTTPGNYDVELVVLTSNGCTDTTNVSVSIFPLPNVNAGVDQTICQGTSISLIATGAASYVWTPSSVSNGQSFTPNTSGNYSVAGTDANGCTDEDQVTITVLPIPIASISVNPLSGFPGDVFTFTNSSSNAISYDWNFGNGQLLSTNNIADQIQSYQAPGTYLVYLVASNSLCEDSAALTVTVLTPDVEILAPNVFTVNDDGVNDEWTIIVKNASSVEVDIQNRWGITMLTLGPNQKWDGTIDGKEATDGVYFYKYKIIDNFGKEFNGHGHFTLIRTN